jgi:dTDP-4-dehydrorhamnose reductase
MRVVIVGASGQLGSDLMETFSDVEPVGLEHRTFDIEHPTAIAAMLLRYKPDVVINTAAFHNVELCETRPDRAFAVNALAVDQLAAQCASTNVALAHVSTDYVFDGELARPYVESDPARPLSAYGISKYAGELLIARNTERVFIFRTSGLYGIRGSSVKGYTFIERMLTQAAEGKSLHVVDDVTFSPSYTRHVATAIRRVIETGRYGTYHITNAGACTWYGFAREIFSQANVTAELSPTTQASFPSLARRPQYSALAHEALLGLGLSEMPDWRVGIREYLSERRA